MRRPFLVAGLLASIGLIAAVAWTSLAPPAGEDLSGATPDPAEAPGGAPEGEVSAGMALEEELGVLLGDTERLGLGDRYEDVSLAALDGEGMRFSIGGVAGPAREIAVRPPEGTRLDPRFTVPNAGAGGYELGFILHPEGGRGFYVSLFEPPAGTPDPGPLRPAQYRQMAEQLAASGHFQLRGDLAEVVEVSPGERGIYFCLERGDGLRMQGGMRLVGARSLTVIDVGLCRRDTAALRARLDLAERAVAGR